MPEKYPFQEVPGWLTAVNWRLPTGSAHGPTSCRILGMIAEARRPPSPWSACRDQILVKGGGSPARPSVSATNRSSLAAGPSAPAAQPQSGPQRSSERCPSRGRPPRRELQWRAWQDERLAATRCQGLERLGQRCLQITRCEAVVRAARALSHRNGIAAGDGAVTDPVHDTFMLAMLERDISHDGVQVRPHGSPRSQPPTVYGAATRAASLTARGPAPLRRRRPAETRRCTVTHDECGRGA